MKTSNYILISFFVFLFGGVFVLFLTSKLHKLEGAEWKTSEKPLEDFSVVVAENGAKFQLKKAEKSGIEINYKKPDTLSFPKLFVRNDTLFVFPWEGKIQSIKMKNGYVLDYDNVIICARKIKEIIAKNNSKVNAVDLLSDSLSINSVGGKVHIWSLKNQKDGVFVVKDPSEKNVLKVNASEKAVVSFDFLHVTNLNLTLNQSELKSSKSDVQVLSGTLKNFSNVESYSKVHMVNLVADTTSTYYLDKKILKSKIEMNEIRYTPNYIRNHY